MLPIEGIFFIPSLVVVPVGIVMLLSLRGRANYPWIWRWAVVACVILCGLFALQVLSTPFYSERDHSPANPGGPSSGFLAVAAVFFIGTCVVIPAFPMLIALAALPPHGGTRLRLVVSAVLVVGILAALMAQKNAAYMADYRGEKSKPQQTRFERFEHLR